MKGRRILAAGFVLAALAALPAAEADGQAGRRTATAGAPGVNPPDPYRDCANTSGKSLASGLPPLPCYKSPFGAFTIVQDAAQNLNVTHVGVGRAKITMTIPPLVNRAQYSVCLSSIANFPCPLDLAFPPNDTSVAPGGYYGVAAKVFVRSPAGTTPEYGVFPATRVAMLAFGSLPVTATVQIRQSTTGRYATPLRLGWFTSGAGIVPGKKVPGYEQFGPAPKNTATQNYYNFEPAPHVTGPIVIRLSEVRVDGQALPVGPSCQTTTTLDLSARGGFYQPDEGRGRPGEYSPLGAGKSYLHGNVVIPSFTGCHNGGDDLDPLITGMVSGPHNHVNVVQAGSLRPFCAEFPTDHTCTASSATAAANTAHARTAPSGARLQDLLANASPTVRRAVARAVGG